MTEYEVMCKAVARLGTTIDYEIEDDEIWLIGSGSDEPTIFKFDNEGKVREIR